MSDERSEERVQVERLVRRVAELEEDLRIIERRLREGTHAIFVLVSSCGSDVAKREWKEAIYSSAIRAQVALYRD